MASVIKHTETPWLFAQQENTLGFADLVVRKYYTTITGQKAPTNPKLISFTFFTSALQKERTFVFQFEHFTLVLMSSQAFVLYAPNEMFFTDVRNHSLNWADKPNLYDSL